MKDLLEDTAQRAIRYLSELDARSVDAPSGAVARLSELDRAFPDEPTSPQDVIRLLDDLGSPATVASAGGRYFGFVTGGSLPAAVAANWLAGAWDQNAHFVVGSPIAAAVEKVALRWITEALSLPASWGGGFVTGTTMGNFTGLAAARHAVLDKVGWDVERQGLFGAPPVTVVVGDEAHSTLFQALAMVGLGSDRVVRVPVDGQGRMKASAFPADLSSPAIVCLQAGNVNTGAFDPIDEIAPRARAAGAWIHVDGAFGLWAGASPRTSHLVQGMAEADSIATDLHKWLNVPYDSGLLLVAEPRWVEAAMALRAAYLPGASQREPCDFTPEGSRRARGVEVWAALLSLGRSGLVELIDRCCGHARRFADGLRDNGFEILNEVVLNQVLVAFGDDEQTRRVIEAVQEEGTCWCGGTEWQGRAAMRISLSSWKTTEDDIERSIEAITRVAKATMT